MFETTDIADLVLFLAGPSLLEQVGAWARWRRNLTLRLSYSRSRAVVRAVVLAARAAVIDATRQPGSAVDVLRAALQAREPSALGVYCGEPSTALEIIVRSHGVLLLHGLITPEQWQAFLARALGGSGGDGQPTGDVFHHTHPAGAHVQLRVCGKHDGGE